MDGGWRAAESLQKYQHLATVRVGMWGLMGLWLDPLQLLFCHLLLCQDLHTCTSLVRAKRMNLCIYLLPLWQVFKEFREVSGLSNMGLIQIMEWRGGS